MHRERAHGENGIAAAELKAQGRQKLEQGCGARGLEVRARCPAARHVRSPGTGTGEDRDSLRRSTDRAGRVGEEEG